MGSKQCTGSSRGSELSSADPSLPDLHGLNTLSPSFEEEIRTQRGKATCPTACDKGLLIPRLSLPLGAVFPYNLVLPMAFPCPGPRQQREENLVAYSMLERHIPS